jgi:hypothetical protein
MISLPMTAEVVRGYIDIATSAPEELSTQIILTPAPPAPFVPEEVVGTPVALVIACWSGDIEEGREVVGRFSKLGGGALIEMVDAMPYSGIFELLREPTAPGMYGSARSAFLTKMDDELIETMVSECPPPMSITQLRVLGGAMARVPAEATAFAHRDKEFILLYAGHGLNPEMGDAAAAWVEQMWEKSKHRSEGVYVNFLGTTDDPARIHEAYPASTYERLVEVKRKYDPQNRFRGNGRIRAS